MGVGYRSAHFSEFVAIYHCTSKISKLHANSPYWNWEKKTSLFLLTDFFSFLHLSKKRGKLKTFLPQRSASWFLNMPDSRREDHVPLVWPIRAAPVVWIVSGRPQGLIALALAEDSGPFDNQNKFCRLQQWFWPTAQDVEKTNLLLWQVQRRGFRVQV